MALSKHDRKDKLGHGGLTKIARRIRRSPGHVAEVNAGRRRDLVAERAITRRIVELHPDVNPGDVWPPEYKSGDHVAQNGRQDVADVREHEDEAAGAH